MEKHGKGRSDSSSLFIRTCILHLGGSNISSYVAKLIHCLLQLGLYTDESPGLKVDPVVVLVLSLGFIFSVVALHGESSLLSSPSAQDEFDGTGMRWVRDLADWWRSYRKDHEKVCFIELGSA